MKSSKGLTLIEVLIAMVVISIAFTAILVSSSQNIRDTKYLEDKMMAAWVSNYITNKIQAGMLILPQSSPLNSKISMFNQDWFWTASASPSHIPTIRKIAVRVSLTENGKTLIEWISYDYPQIPK